MPGVVGTQKSVTESGNLDDTAARTIWLWKDNFKISQSFRSVEHYICHSGRGSSVPGSTSYPSSQDWH